MKKLRISLFLILFFSVEPLFSVESADLTETELRLLNSLPADQRQGILTKMTQAKELDEEIANMFEEVNTVVLRPQKKVMTEEELKEYRAKSKQWIFGYEMFTSSPTTFAPATDIPVTKDYILGPGDELKIQTYGTNNQKSSSFVSRNGDISIPKLGPVSVAGLTLDKAIEVIQKKVSSELTGTEAYVTLGKLRTITIYILGEAYQPGAYKISSLSTVTNALFVSGGVDVMGSVRNIKIKRNGKTFQTFDLYKLLLEGDTSYDMRLQEGDTIFIPLLQKKARVYGSFRRPHLFELIEGDKVKDLIYYAGGLNKPALIDGKLELTRLQKNSIEVVEFSSDDKESLLLDVDDGDTLSAQALSSLETGVVELKGEFKYPGFYNIRRNEKIADIIKRAGGLTSEAYTYGAVFTRTSVADQQKLSFQRNADYLEQTIADAITSGNVANLSAESFGPMSALIKRLRELEPSGRQVVVADPIKIKADPRLNFTMVDEDVLFIPPRPNDITIVGEVLSPTSVSFKSGSSPIDYVQRAGGLKDTADKDRIFLILPNGESQGYSSSRFLGAGSRPQILPGSTVVVPRDPQPFSWLVLAQTITPILADTATAIATVEALLD